MLTEEEIDAAILAIGELGAYFEAFLAERRREPRDDLMSALAEASENDDRLTDDEILSTAILLFSAGFETTTNLLGNGLLALLAHPEQLADWRAHPEIAPSAVEELLRFDSPVQFNLRAALEPAELAGQPLERGDRIVVLQGAANRDPEEFDRPEELDLRRSPNTPLSFGWGIHHCIGAALARLEGEIAFNALLARFDTIELSDEEPQWRPGFTLRGLQSFPLRVARSLIARVTRAVDPLPFLGRTERRGLRPELRDVVGVHDPPAVRRRKRDPLAAGDVSELLEADVPSGGVPRRLRVLGEGHGQRQHAA